MGSTSHSRCQPSRPILPLLLVLIFMMTSCVRGTDRLYALALPRPPTDLDWKGAIPLRVEAMGGKTTSPAESDVDSDAVHTATASCHHGLGAPKVIVEIRAFYTPERVYLRFEWGDPTVDEGTFWRWGGREWVAERAGGADGLGVLWGSTPKTFACVHYCHLQDWRMVGPRGLADYAMGTLGDERFPDFWTWRAGRGSRAGQAEDGRLGHRGFEGDTTGKLFEPNSLRARAGQPDSFGPGDAPYSAPAAVVGATAPGELIFRAPLGRTEVRAEGKRNQGGWQVTLSRGLQGVDPGDIEFVPGRKMVFGLSIFDGVAKDHNAVATPLHLVLVDSRELARLKE